jgi:hypothetical protein
MTGRAYTGIDRDGTRLIRLVTVHRYLKIRQKPTALRTEVAQAEETHRMSCSPMPSGRVGY